MASIKVDRGYSDVYYSGLAIGPNIVLTTSQVAQSSHGKKNSVYLKLGTGWVKSKGYIFPSQFEESNWEQEKFDIGIVIFYQSYFLDPFEVADIQEQNSKMDEKTGNQEKLNFYSFDISNWTWSLTKKIQLKNIITNNFFNKAISQDIQNNLGLISVSTVFNQKGLISTGNRGGPLVNEKREVVGTAVYSKKIKNLTSIGHSIRLGERLLSVFTDLKDPLIRDWISQAYETINSYKGNCCLCKRSFYSSINNEKLKGGDDQRKLLNLSRKGRVSSCNIYHNKRGIKDREYYYVINRCELIGRSSCDYSL